MHSNLTKKLLVLSIIGTVSIFTVVGAYFINKFYSNIFRLSTSQVSNFLSYTQPQCTKIFDCTLLPGDILIRRHITKRTWLIDKLARPHFTHSAFYLGNDQIVEAVGREKYPEDEIQIAILSKSDWLKSNINDFVIIRPKNYSSKLDTIKSNLKDIAEDPEYIFGLPKQGYKRATCADLIFKQLSDENIIDTSNVPKMITPDYLFFVTKSDPENFEIIGYNIPN